MWISREGYNHFIGLEKELESKTRMLLNLRVEYEEKNKRLLTCKEENHRIVMSNYNLKKELEETYDTISQLKKDLERLRKMLWNLQTECDEKDIYRKLGHKSQMCNALKLKNKELEKELKEAYETISKLEKERKKLSKRLHEIQHNHLYPNIIATLYDIIDDKEKEIEQLKVKNKNQSSLIVEQLRKLQKQETPDPLNGETLGAFYD